MKSARNQLILLGFICQALTWDDFLLPALCVFLWFACLAFFRGRMQFTANTECLMMFGGWAVALSLGRWLGHNIQFFIGHGFTVIQAARLLRPLDRREKIFSIVMACFQLGVGCTFLFDLRFVPIFFALVYLLPKSLAELETESFTKTETTPLLPQVFGSVAIIFLLAAAVFLVFPRGIFGRALPQLANTGGQNPGSLLDDVVDPSQSSSAQSHRVLLQIQGRKMGLLRCYCLSEFDGTRWTAAPFQHPEKIQSSDPAVKDRALSRLVHVKQISYLSRVLPADGRVIVLKGGFFRNPVRSAQDNISCEAIWNTGNNTYEYQIDPTPAPAALPDSLRVRMTRLPPQSDRLQNWLNTLTSGETNAEHLARKLESYLRDNFKYALGAPELRRLDPIDDFVFNQKQGHCERFASTLAVLLRMKNIPARVVIGYIPRQRGNSGDWFTVRFSDAHSWTEAYFDGIGWTPLDATPAATTFEKDSPLRDLWDTVDLAWNLNVVNFDGASQQHLLRLSGEGLSAISFWIRANAVLLISLFGALIALLLWRNFQKTPRAKSVHQPRQAQIIATHYYGQMLRALARQGFHRSAEQTPLEFLNTLSVTPFQTETELITRAFCETRYGERPFCPGEEEEIQCALERIKKPAK